MQTSLSAHQRSLISTFVVRCFDNMICLFSDYLQSVANVAEQAGLKISEDTFSRDVAHVYTHIATYA